MLIVSSEMQIRFIRWQDIGHNYLMKAGGDSYIGFVDNIFIIEEGILDYQILTTYITDYLNGSLGRLYSDIEGRIVVN